MDPISRKILLKFFTKRISRIQENIEKERKSLIESGFAEDHPMFDEKFFLIQEAYMKDLLPLIVQRHKLLPYSEEEAKEYAFWMDFLHDATLDKPPEEMLHPPVRAKR